MTHDYGHALEVAISAALQAGGLIRADFHRDGGPRGSGHHADVDDEAEAVIRRVLRDAFPEWAYLGEETGRDGPTGADHRWLVDPNDGTASYLRGMRGSAVSIGLARDGVPVLGVVFAPVAPDSGGDLIAWREGGPLLRNGQPVERAPLPAALGPLDIVLVSQDADRNAEANLACVAPARYRAVPSIAYRLALVAVGEGEAAVSLNGPTSWDLAGGHALIRAVGGDLFDERGRLIRYHGNGGGRYVFGATEPVAAKLRAAQWQDVFAPGATDPLSRRFPPVRLARGRAVADPGMLSRAQGCLLGQVAGDSLGGLVEFSTADEIRRKYPGGLRELSDGGHWGILAGQPTDDSELALILARAIVRDGGYTPEAAREAYVAWRDSGPFDIGGTTAAGLAGRPNLTSEANGALMRVSPLGIYAHALPAAEAGELGRCDAAITHPHPVCRDASGAFVVAVAHAIRTGEEAEAAYRAAVKWAKGARAEESVIQALDRAREGPPREYQHQMGWVLIALQNAFWQALEAERVESGVVETVVRGGDTDTNGAIVGALLGAIHGGSAVPAAWMRAVLSCRPAGQTPTRHPRPRAFWPGDLLEMAETLLVAAAARPPHLEASSD